MSVEVLKDIRKEPPRIHTNFKVIKIKYEPTDGEYIELK